MESLREVLPSLVALAPRFMTVTYGAMGTTRIRTVEIASMIHNEFELECACHLTCVGAHSDQIDAQLDHIHRHGIENIVALRGDPPRGQDSFQAVKGGFSYANELVEHIRSRGGFDIAVGGYPEKHVEAPDMETDLSNLARKVEGGADVVITQLFYDNECFFRFLEEVRKRGITCPVIPGLLPIHSQAQVEKIAGLCGAEIPAGLQRSLEATGTDPEAAAEVEALIKWDDDTAGGIMTTEYLSAPLQLKVSQVIERVGRGGDAGELAARFFLDLRFRLRREVLGRFEREAREVRAGLALLRASEDGYVLLKDEEAQGIAARIDLSSPFLRSHIQV